MINFKILESLVITYWTVGPYDIIIIQDPHGDFIDLRIEEYEE